MQRETLGADNEPGEDHRKGIRHACRKLGFLQEQVRAVISRRVSEFPFTLSVDVVSGSGQPRVLECFLRAIEPFAGSHSNNRHHIQSGLPMAACGRPPSSAVPKAEILAVLNVHRTVLVGTAQRDSSAKSIMALASAAHSQAGPLRKALQKFRQRTAIDSPQ